MNDRLQYICEDYSFDPTTRELVMSNGKRIQTIDTEKEDPVRYKAIQEWARKYIEILES